MPRRIELCPAHVLVVRAYRETGALIEAFTRDHGRVGLVARGVRGPKARQRGLLQVFAPLLLAWTESGELGSLATAEADGPAAALSGERIFHGWYINELLMRLLSRHDPHPVLYAGYIGTLRALADGNNDNRAECALREFELSLLAELGYGMDLDMDFDAMQRYRHDAAEGFAPSFSAGAESYSGASLIALRDGSLAASDAAIRREARKLLRAAIARQLGGRELETPKLLRAMRAQMGVSHTEVRDIP